MSIPLPLAQLKKLLVDESVLTGEQFDVASVEADRKGQSILDVLVANGSVESDYLNNLIARILGVPRVNFSHIPIDNTVVRIIPENIARERETIAFKKEDNGSYDVAMANPSDLEAIKFFEQRLHARINPYFATENDLREGYSIYGYALGEDFKKIIREKAAEAIMSQAKNIKEAAADIPIVGIVENILSYALASRASDIHIEVLEESMFVRYRIDGILYGVMEVTKAVHPAIVARLKLLAGAKIDEHYAPQDGRFRYKVGNQTIDVRLSVIPTFYGEKVELRLLESSQKPLSLKDIGIMEEDEKIILRNIERTYGMILSCGPTGSGKTTTLYAMMNILNKPEVNITTIEDPIEYNMPYVNQTQINVQAGISFASGLRALLRQDPNIIMVGEIRDDETADISVQAALTGHLLLSSLHTNDAPTTIPRLFDLKVAPFLVSSVLNLIIAQRLVRKVCETCVYSYDLDEEMKDIIKEQFEELGIATEHMKIPKAFYRGKGCATCGETGYRGRIGIFEVLEATNEIKKIIMSPDFSLAELRAQAHAAGMKTMFEDGLLKIELAITTIDEVMRVIRE